MGKFWIIFLLGFFISTPASHAQETDEGFISLNKIENALSPLDVLLNHGGIRRSIDLDIRFDFNSDTILEQATIQLDMLGEALIGERLSALNIQIVGHTDAVGNAGFNRALSLRRAASVKDYLVKNFAVAPERLEAIGKGEDQLLPKKPADSAEQRRVEIIALKKTETKSGIDW